MASVPCCTPCPEVQTVNIPGIQGATGATGPAGADGAPGMNEWVAEYGGDVVTLTALTETPAAMGGADPLTLTDAGEYLLLATVHLKWNAATTLAGHTVTLVWRRLNHTAANISPVGGTALIVTPVVTDESGTLAFVPIPPMVYTALAGDIVDVFGSIDTLPYTGELEHVQCAMVAVKLGP